MPAAVLMATTLGLPSVSVPVLSTTSVSTFSMRSRASAFLISTPDCAPRPTPTMIDIGVARPSAHGHAMISTETAAIRPYVKRGSGPQMDHAAKANNSNENDGRHEPGRNLIGQPLNWRAAALGLGHHLHDLREHGVAPDLVGAHDEAARLVHRAADHLVTDALGHGHRLARHHRLVDRAAPFEDGAVHRNALAGTHAQAVARGHLIEAHILVRAVGPDAPRHLRREIEQRANGAAGLFAGPQLEHLAEQHEDGDDGRRFEIDGNRAVMRRASSRETDPATRCRRCCRPKPPPCPWQ